MRIVIVKGLLLLLPLVVLLGFFVLDDPMRVMNRYDSPVERGVLMNDRLFKTRVLLKHDRNFNAFIFGSSRGNAFKTAAWKKNLPNGALPYHLAMNDETLFGIARKLQFLDRQGYVIRHALILLDERLMGLDHNQSAHIFREHYQVSGETSVEFYKNFLMAFLKPSFLKTYVNYRLGRYEIKKDDVLLWDPGFGYVAETGDIIYKRYDSLLTVDSAGYYARYQRDAFYDRGYAETYVPEPALTAKGIELLREALTVLRKHNADYEVVLTPNYSQKASHRSDVDTLESIFGADRVHNFTGINAWTSCVCNYYEERHFKPYVANWVMDSVYSD